MSSSLPSPSRSLPILKTVFYVLAALVLLLGLVAGFSLVSSAGRVAENATLPLQILGGGAISNLIAPVITGFLTNLGIAVLVICALLSALLYGVGRLLGHIALLEARLSRLEAGPLGENQNRVYPTG
jgi:hypothetical protein